MCLHLAALTRRSGKLKPKLRLRSGPFECTFLCLLRWILRNATNKTQSQTTQPPQISVSSVLTTLKCNQAAERQWAEYTSLSDCANLTEAGLGFWQPVLCLPASSKATLYMFKTRHPSYPSTEVVLTPKLCFVGEVRTEKHHAALCPLALVDSLWDFWCQCWNLMVDLRSPAL